MSPETTWTVWPFKFGESRRLQFGFGNRTRTWDSRKMSKTAPEAQEIQTKLPRGTWLLDAVVFGRYPVGEEGPAPEGVGQRRLSVEAAGS